MDWKPTLIEQLDLDIFREYYEDKDIVKWFNQMARRDECLCLIRGEKPRRPVRLRCISPS